MKLFVFGMGFSATVFAVQARARGDEIIGTVRSRDKAALLSDTGLTMRVFGPAGNDEDIGADIASSDAMLVSIPPDADGDPVLRAYSAQISAASKLRWIGYLSTIGVYGDHGGAWIDEQTSVNATNLRSRHREVAEREWLTLGTASGIPVQIFRLAGIYGPGRNQLVQMAEGTAKRIIKPGQVFNRIHVADIARVLDASLARPRQGGIYNVTDNDPAPPQDVVTFAARLCGRDPPPETALDDAQLTPMGRSFYEENKRVRNALIHDELGVTLAYPTYREGLTALHEAGDGTQARSS